MVSGAKKAQEGPILHLDLLKKPLQKNKFPKVGVLLLRPRRPKAQKKIRKKKTLYRNTPSKIPLSQKPSVSKTNQFAKNQDAPAFRLWRIKPKTRSPIVCGEIEITRSSASSLALHSATRSSKALWTLSFKENLRLLLVSACLGKFCKG